MARQSAQAAFRYHRQPGEAPGVALNWTRFADSKLPGAVAESATVTTLVTREGRSLTEIRLLVRNRQQPFLKVALPAGASIVSADVAGEAVKAVQGADGSRVPLLRAGFRPRDAYHISFVILHSGVPFGKKGAGELALPRMDVPVGLVEWEVFLPEQYRVKDFGGDAVAAALLPRSQEFLMPLQVLNFRPGPGSIGGVITDPAGAVVPNVAVTVRHEATGLSRTATADTSGRWVVVGMPPGRLTVQVDSPGFKRYFTYIDKAEGESKQVDIALQVGAATESITISAEAPLLKTEGSDVSKRVRATQLQDLPTLPSPNVTNLQRRVAGVLPIPVEVPKAGTSYRFVRPLVVDEETKLTFAYRGGR